MGQSEPVNPPPSHPLPLLPSSSHPLPSLENAKFSAGDIGDFGPGQNLRPKKTPQTKISERKLFRPKPLESVPQFFCLNFFASIFLPLPSPSNKAGWAFTVNCSEINISDLHESRHFRPKDSASKRCTDIWCWQVLASDSGQPYAGEWTKCESRGCPGRR